MDLNFPLPSDHIFENNHYKPDLPNSIVGLNSDRIPLSSSSSSSSSFLSWRVFYNRTSDGHMLYHNQPDQHLQEGNTSAYKGKGGSYAYEIKNKVSETRVRRLTKWKIENDHDYGQEMEHEKNNRVKWTSNSDMRVMHTMNSSCYSATLETDFSIKKTSSSCNFNSNNPIRVCSDCKTTKTPLWRSGPKGPKSLCNACGISQRKARQALAASKTKVERKDNATCINNVNVTPPSKRYKIASTNSPFNGQNLSFEDSLINLSNNLGFYRVFPKDEMDAAMLLMAISSGLIHG